MKYQAPSLVDAMINLRLEARMILSNMAAVSSIGPTNARCLRAAIAESIAAEQAYRQSLKAKPTHKAKA
jgi:hypothetical protein